MDVLIIFAIIFGVIKLIASTAKKSGQQKNTGTQHTETRTAPTPRQTTDNRAPISPTVHTTVHPHESSLRQPSVFGTEKSASRACPHCGIKVTDPKMRFCMNCGKPLVPVTRTESTVHTTDAKPPVQSAMRPHVVESSFTPGSHAHMETSMSGITDCGIYEPVSASGTDDGQRTVQKKVIGSGDDIVRGFIMAELLMEPKAKRGR